MRSTDSATLKNSAGKKLQAIWRPIASVLTALCLSASVQAQDPETTSIEVWHTFIADTQEELLFTETVEAFEARHPDIDVEIVRIPYLQMLQQFITAAQGGEAPDLVRVNSRDLGKLGEVNVNGAPVLEDLRPHLTPMERARLDARSVNAMRYQNALYSLPVSQSSLSLIYNKALFDAKGVPYPDDDWTLADLLSAARELTDEEHYGLAFPVKIYFWWVAFQTGFGGWLFDENGEPTLNAAGSADALQWVIDLELEHAVVPPGMGFDIEGAKTVFQQGRAAMTIDGPWNWMAFDAAGLELGQALLPRVAQSGERMSPLLAYIGWSVTKQSRNKVAAVELAKWLASDDVQRDFALQTYTLPTSNALKTDQRLAAAPYLSGFLRQSEAASPAPTTKAMALAYEPLNTAIEMAYTGKMAPQAALDSANEALKSSLEN